MSEQDGADEAEFLALRPLLFSLAYRMTGSVADAEDLVSESYLRLRRARGAGTEIESMKTYLSAVVTRLGIDQLRSARARRETYVGPWMPEPLVDNEIAPEFERVEVADTLSIAFLVLLETLSPIERAVFLLREVFEFDYPRIAEIVGRNQTYCRQLLARAKQHVEAGRPRFEADRAERDDLAARFFAAVGDGDLEPLVGMLASDVVAYGDGGGNGPSLPQPINGPAKVLRLLAAVTRAIAEYQLHLRPTPVNGQPGAMMLDSDGRLLNVFALDILDGRVQAVRSILNPDKLRHLGPLIDSGHPLRGGPRVSRSE